MSIDEKKMFKFLLEELRPRLAALDIPETSVDGNFDLVGSGAVDSLGFIELVGAVESEFNVELDFEDMDPTEFTLIDGFIRCAAKRRIAVTGVPEIERIDSVDTAILDQIEALLVEMYGYMSNHGLTMGLAQNGASRWRLGVERTLGRMGTVVIAKNGEAVIGFIRGVIRLAPDHLGSSKIGFVDHTFVMSEFRGQGIGKRMFTELENWFREKGVKRLELQVLCENESGTAVWSALGFQPELLQMQKTLT